MTELVDIGVAITGQTKNLMRTAFEKDGLPTALRVTICDIRDRDRPPQMRSGRASRVMIEAFTSNARAGGDLLSIESTGGKEVSDRALMEADIPGLLLALGILAPRDMHFLWREIVDIAGKEGVVPAGDTACAFANTAMVLADRNYIPNVLAAVVRAMSAVRSLVAFEEGACGPSKDCAYEGPVLKAITGCPISMEGKASACAHFSHVGNVAAATCDLWSNESVQNVQLLSGYAPEVFSEILAYDCRLMNEALRAGDERTLQRLLIASDVESSVHALVISPEASIHIAEAIISEHSDFRRTRSAGLAACAIIREALDRKKLELPKRERDWLDRIETSLTECGDEQRILDEGSAKYSDAFISAEYGL
jgi:methanol--5-hydroxybenzimidazolylcobamide Co-methyltransferase